MKKKMKILKINCKQWKMTKNRMNNMRVKVYKMDKFAKIVLTYQPNHKKKKNKRN